MTSVDNALDTVTEEPWEAVAVEEAPRVTVAPPVPAESRLIQFLRSIAASMALQRSTRHRTPCQTQTFDAPIDILAQNYPHLYLRVMFG